MASVLQGLHYNATIVHGDCPTGSDAQAQQFCEDFGIVTERHPADWSKGRSAGPKRNQQMVDLGADIVLAFMEEGSKGTKHCVGAAQRAGLPVVVHRLFYPLENKDIYEVSTEILNEQAYLKFMSGE